MRLKALAEIYTMHSFAPFFNLKISAKNRQHFFASEYWISDFSFSASNFEFFCECLMKFCPDFATNSRKEWRMSLFKSNLRKQIRKLPKIEASRGKKILKSVKIKIIQYYSMLFIRVLTWRQPSPAAHRAQSLWAVFSLRADGTKASQPRKTWGICTRRAGKLERAR